jgi:hypothetical protein
MPTLQSYVDLLPVGFKNRYTLSGHLLQWGNELLEELQERGFLPIVSKETGQIVDNDCWIDKPSDALFIDKIYDPKDRKNEFRFEDVNNKIHLLDVTYDPDDEDDWETANSFSSYAVGSIRIAEGDIDDKIEDELENYLFRITGGTSANLGIVLSGNDATVTAGSGYTTVYFLHELSAALDAIKLTEAKLVPPWQYVMIKYRALLDEISALGDEFPIPTDCEKRLIPTWLRWKCEQHTLAVSKETQYWENETMKLLWSIQAARSKRPITPVIGRRLVGMEKGVDMIIKNHPDYSEF